MSRDDVIKFTNSFGESLSVVIPDICSIIATPAELVCVTHMNGHQTLRVGSDKEGRELLIVLEAHCNSIGCSGLIVSDQFGYVAYIIHAYNVRIDVKDEGVAYDTCACVNGKKGTMHLRSKLAEDLANGIQEWVKHKYLKV